MDGWMDGRVGGVVFDFALACSASCLSAFFASFWVACFSFGILRFWFRLWKPMAHGQTDRRRQNNSFLLFFSHLAHDVVFLLLLPLHLVAVPIINNNNNHPRTIHVPHPILSTNTDGVGNQLEKLTANQTIPMI